MTAATTSATTETRTPGTPRTLDDLLALDAPALLALYQTAKTPKLADLDGDYEGRMLASPLGGERVGGAMRTLAKWRFFPWLGKSFTRGTDRGEGVNRVFKDSNKWFRFETTLGRSRAGDFDAVQLDYDRPGNPGVIRAVKDEVREVAPGLYLGQAYMTVRGTPKLAVYFALADKHAS
jgi:hypothetical protein